jgi:phage gpG-like protein
MQHFKREEGPEGKWKGLSDITIYRRRKGKKKRGDKILQDTGTLKNSIAAVSNNRGAEVGTNIIYAKAHQFGKGRIPQRTFLFLSKEAQNRILDRFILDMRDL